MAGHRVIFLDRDGVLNVDHGFIYRIEDWDWTPGAMEALKILRDKGYKLAVITNQSGIGRGQYTEEDMHKVHRHMTKELAKHGVLIDAIAYCVHGRDSTCDCRKPRTGMAKQVAAAIGPIDYAASWTIGDKIVDWQFGKTLGTHTALVRSEYWKVADLTVKPDVIVDSLHEWALTVAHP